MFGNCDEDRISTSHIERYDQRGDRTGGIRVSGQFQIGLRKIFGVMFWVCDELLASPNSVHNPARNRYRYQAHASEYEYVAMPRIERDTAIEFNLPYGKGGLVWRNYFLQPPRGVDECGNSCVRTANHWHSILNATKNCRLQVLISLLI